jgi:hypothetical protein
VDPGEQERLWKAVARAVRRARAQRLRARGLTYLLQQSRARLHRLRERRWATLECVKLDIRQRRQAVLAARAPWP